MGRKIGICLALFLAAALARAEGFDPALFAGGKGTEEAPYLIAEAAQLRLFADAVNGGESFEKIHIRLDKDITLSGDWTPIGHRSPFDGVFDGNGRLVSYSSQIRVGAKEGRAKGLDDLMFYGLFGILGENAEVRDLRIAGKIAAEMPTGVMAGLLAGYAGGALIDDVCVSGEIELIGLHPKAHVIAGGLIGRGDRQIVVNACAEDVRIRAVAAGGMAQVGGIAGMNNRGIIANAYVVDSELAGEANVAVGGKAAIGGLVGLHAGNLKNAYVALVVRKPGIATPYVGALSGWATGIAVTEHGYFDGADKAAGVNVPAGKARGMEYPGAQERDVVSWGKDCAALGAKLNANVENLRRAGGEEAEVWARAGSWRSDKACPRLRR